MKLAISGKGGSGKTTIAGTLARIYAREGHRVVAIDGDPNPNLAVTLGIPVEARSNVQPLPRDLMVERDDENGKKVQVLGVAPEAVAAQYGVRAPDDVLMLLGSRVDHPGRGWLCGAHATVRSMLGELVGGGEDVTILDMEASIEHMSRGTVRNVDTLLVVVEPYYRALETAGRMAELARGLGIPRVYAVANKVHDAADEGAVRDYCARHDLSVIASVPFDRAVVEADRAGGALIDHDAGSPAVLAIKGMAHELTGQEGGLDAG